MKDGSFPRWFRTNIALLLLALILAFIVWVSAVFAADPNEECAAPRSIPLEVRNLPGTYRLFGDLPEVTTVRLFAPRSVCLLMAEDAASVQAYIDLAGLEPGEHTLPVTYAISDIYEPVRTLGLSPASVSFVLEEIATRSMSITLQVIGAPAPGYNLGPTILSESRVVISGTRSLVDQVATASVSVDVTDAVSELNVTRAVQLADGNGNPISGVTISPAAVTIRQIVNRPGIFREVIVRVVYTGSPADGYRLTSIAPTPQIVTIFSNDAQLIRELPGFVETEPLDLSGATDDIEVRLPLVLPEGVFVDGEQSVLVQVGIAAIESSITISLPVERIGLAAGLEASLSPENVDVILSGPLPILTSLQPLDVRVVLDLTGYEAGEYTVEPRIEILPIGLVLESMLPGAIEVTIIELPTSTPDPNAPFTPTPSPTPPPAAPLTPTPTPTPTPGAPF